MFQYTVQHCDRNQTDVKKEFINANNQKQDYTPTNTRKESVRRPVTYETTTYMTIFEMPHSEKL